MYTLDDCELFFRNWRLHWESNRDKSIEIQFSMAYDHRLNATRSVAQCLSHSLYCNICATTDIFLWQFSFIGEQHKRTIVCVPYVCHIPPRIGTARKHKPIYTYIFLLKNKEWYYIEQSTFRCGSLAIVLIVFRILLLSHAFRLYGINFYFFLTRGFGHIIW